MVSLIQTGTCTISEITAITFTRKAAAELRQRVQNELERVYQEETDPEKAKCLNKALSNLHQCFLGTIHAFCTRLLWERPMEAGLDGDFEVIEETEDIEEEAWDRYLLKVRGTSPASIEKLQEKGFSRVSLREAYREVLAYRDVSFPAVQVDRPDLQPVLKGLRALVAEGYREIPYPPKEDRYDSLQKKIRQAHRFFRYRSLERDEERLALLLIFEKGQFPIIQKLWSSREKAKEFRGRFEAFQEERIKPVLKKWQEHCYQPVIDFLLPAVKEFQVLKKELGVMDFQDLLMKTAWLLRENGEVRGYFQKKYPRIFVDEFQDTDPIQSEVMLFLCSDDLQEKDWQKITVRPGSLFVVGDPKQSIYRFRRADLDVYSYVKKKMQESGAEIVHLTSNFRSVHSIGDFCNSVFKGVFPSTANQYQAQYEPMNTLMEEGPSSGVFVLNISEDYKKNAHVITEDAERIAAHVRSLLDQGTYQPKDFLVLLHYKMNLTAYAKAFEDQDIPVRMTGGNSLAGNREIQELLSLCQALAYLDDTVALAAVLRGIFFGFSDADLFAFKKGGGAFHMWAPIPEGVDTDVAEKFSTAYSQLQQYYQLTESLSPAAAFQEIIDSLGLVPYLLARELGESCCGHLLQVLEWIRHLEHHDLCDWISLVEQLERLISSAPEEEMRIDSTHEDALRLMNLHKAKGLEAEVVFLVDPVKGGPKRVDFHVQRIGGEAKGYLCIRNHRGVPLALPKDWETYEREEEQYLQAEENRLLYVAATRARQMLSISRSLYPGNKKKNPWGLLLEDTSLKPLPGGDVGMERSRKEAPLSVLPQDDFFQVMGALSSPTYRKFLPSELQIMTGPTIQVEGEGGVDWGHAVHAVLESYVKGVINLQTVMKQALFQYGLDPGRRTELELILTRFQEKLGPRIEQAQMVLTEVPFSLDVRNEEPLQAFLSLHTMVTGPLFVSGVMDLVLKEKTGWCIVDYKTDRVKKREDLNMLVKRYRNQLALYLGAWEAITGEKGNDILLYFLYSDELIAIDG